MRKRKNKQKRVDLGRNRYLYWGGNSLMIVGVLLLFFIYYPLIQVYFFPQEIVVSREYSQEPTVIIPKIHAKAPVIENVDPWNSKEYLESLKSGVAQAEGTSEIGDRGTIYFFAHSSDLPWRITKYNTAFFRLGELEKGDEVYLEKQGKRYIYSVEKKIEVSPSEVKYLREDQGDVLILQTCTPPGTDFRRLLVFATPVKH